MTQLALPGLETPLSDVVHQLFFAVMPDADTAARIAALANHWQSEAGIKAKPRPTGHLHVTLNVLGAAFYLPPPVIAPARAPWPQVSARCRST